MGKKPKVGFYGLTGCAGDLLNIINCEDELVEL
ncbi:MAG TPA: NADH:ubiquinone oxidoreductase, partial [candidate division WOR-3 bacterium]|nr:NADH:ubiquinone oxidoreductase [candidate division WOR-3 bacterium]